MQPIKAVIIDDEKNAISVLQAIITEFAPQVAIVGTAHNASEGMQVIKGTLPDVVFVDIQMPHMSGIEMLEILGNDRGFELVFLTAYNTYAQEAFRLNAFYYLLKPIHIPDFLMVINKLGEKRSAEELRQRHDHLKEVFSNKISVPSLSGTEFITISDIIRVEASGSYVLIHLKTGKPLVFAKSLKTMEELLKHKPFFRAHKSHLINITFIQKFISLKDGGTIIMADGSEIDLSRNHKEEFVSMYKL